MGRMNKVKIVFILVFFLGMPVFSQEKQIHADMKLGEEILSVYQSEGEHGLRNFIRNKKDKIPDRLIVYFAVSAIKQGKEECAGISEILAEEKKLKTSLAFVYLKIADYYFTRDYKKADICFDKALPIFVKSDDRLWQGKVYLRKGLLYSIFKSNDSALELYNKALPSFVETGDIRGQGDVYMSKGIIYSKTGENTRALEFCEKALSFYEKCSFLMGKGNAYYHIGSIFVHFNDYSKATEMYDKAMALYTKIEFLSGMADIFKAKGDICFYKGKYADAEKMNEKALFYYDKANDPLGQSDVLKRKGDIYLIKNDYKNAEKMYNKAMIIFEKVGVPLAMSEVFIGKGDVYFYKGDLINAEKMYDKALIFLERGGSIIQRGDAFKRKGNIYFYKGDYVNTIKMYNQALVFYEKTGEYSGQGNVFKSKGDLYFYRGNYIYAEKMYDKALVFFEKTGDQIGLGNVYQCKGNICLEKENYEKAKNMYNRALDCFKKANEPIGQGNVLIRKGDICFYNQDPTNAKNMYDQALNFFEKSEEPFGMCIVYYRKGGIYFHNGDISRALDMYEIALELCQKTGNIESESYVLHSRAEALVKLDKKDEALDIFEKAIEKLETTRTQTALSEIKRTFMGKVYEQYEETVLFMLKNNYGEKGFEYADKMRARVFLDRLAEGMKKVDKGLSPGFKQRRDRLVFRLAALKKNIADEIKKENKNQKKLDELKKELNEIGIKLDNLSVEIRQENPRYASLFYPEPVELKNLREKILKKDELLLEYFVSKEGVYLFMVSREDFEVKKLEVSMDTIDKVLKKYQDSILESSSQPKESRSTKNKIIRSLEYLYSFLLKPVEKKIEGKKLIFAPDAKLAKIPFEALVSGRDKKTRKTVFLIEKYPIKYIQSASALAFLRSREKREVINDNLVAFGDPVYDYPNFKMGKPEKGSYIRSHTENDEIKEVYRSLYVRDGGTFDRLTGSSEEVRTIAGLFEKKGQKPVLYLRDKATEKNAKSPGMNRFGYIHFGCHGAAGDEFQSLVLSQDIPGATEDGFFSFDEIMNCDYNAQLVVLSACKTNLGKIARGEGLIGLTRAVMYAGTPAVVASLWKVEDTATKELMIRFYKNLLEKGMEKSEALRQAKLELLKKTKYSSLLFWSAFVMYGE
jgi:CHAT domain-containing protein/predicted negative regulator of RcsB-dependent stress response